MIAQNKRREIDMEDLVIRNGLIVTPYSTIRGGLAVRNDRIVPAKGVYSGPQSWSLATPTFHWDCYLGAIGSVRSDYIIFGTDCDHFKNISHS